MSEEKPTIAERIHAETQGPTPALVDAFNHSKPKPEGRTIGPEAARLIARLTGDPTKRLVNFNVFRGDGNATAEDVARAVNKALDQHEAGTAIITTTFDDPRPTINVREDLENLL